MSQTQATHTESLDGHDPDHDVQKKVKSRRPASERRFPVFKHSRACCLSDRQTLHSDSSG